MNRFDRAIKSAAFFNAQEQADRESMPPPTTSTSRKRKVGFDEGKRDQIEGSIHDAVLNEQLRKMEEFGIERHQAAKLGLFGMASTKKPHKRGRFVSLANKVLDVAKKDARKASDQITNSLILQKWEHPMLKGNPLMKTECEGDRLVKKINAALEYLDENGFERSSQQRLFHRAFLQASYKMFYGNELHKNLVRLLEENNLSELRTEVACTTPRRFGKTFAVAMFAAVCLVCLTGHDTSIYSTSSRVSKMLLQVILTMVQILQQKFGGQVKEIDKNEYVHYTTNEGHVNSCHAYPAKSETLRGTGSKRAMGTVVLEEAAFIPPEVVTSIVAPTLTRDNVNLFAISTINSEDVVMKGFMNAKYEDGRSVMLCLNFSLVCSECKATGRVETCKHLLGELPHWSSAGQHVKLAAMLKDAQETLQREIRGLDISENVVAAFNAQAVKILFEDELCTVDNIGVQQMLYTTIDPACGGSGSAYSMLTCCYIGDKCVIVGGEEVPGDRVEERQKTVLEHLHNIRMREEFAGAHIVVCVETNLPGEAEWMCNYLREKKVKNITIMREHKDNKDGWWTTNESKKFGVIRMNSILNERRLKFYKHLSRFNGKHKENNAAELKLHLCQQLQSFCRVVLPQKNVWDEPKEKYTGKYSGRDDLAICSMIGILAYERFKARSDFYGPGLARII